MESKLTYNDREHITDIVENEGFDYTFVHYSNFTEIKDEEFHRLRTQFLEARKKLAEHIGLKDHFC